MNANNSDKLVTPDCVSGEFLSYRCEVCKQMKECYSNPGKNFVCDDCPVTKKVNNQKS